MTVRVDKKVWDVAAREAAEHEDWAISLLLRADQGVDALEAALAEVLPEISERYEREVDAAEDSDDVDFPGSWGTVRVASGVLLVAAKFDVLEAFDALVRAIAVGLEGRGISGTIRLWTKPAGVRAPSIAPIIACRVRLRGSRERFGERNYSWRPDADALDAVLEGADVWTKEIDGHSPLRSVTLGLIGPLDLAPSESPVPRLREAVATEPFARLVAASAGDFRGVGVDGVGALSLVAGGASLERGDWLGAVEEMTAFLRRHADAVVYGRIRRGWQVLSAMVGHGLSTDWPRRQSDEPFGSGMTSISFEDIYAPDAFGVQLLGSGYVGRIPATKGWTSEQLATSTLLCHDDPDAWFAQPFIDYPPAPHLADAPDAPDVLAQARSDLRPILYTPGVLVEAGFTDMTAT